jgi:hypothetical protein
MVNETNAVPNPGTQEALSQGCTCPVVDNHHGKGFRGHKGVFIYFANCPVHDRKSPTEGHNE